MACAGGLDDRRLALLAPGTSRVMIRAHVSGIAKEDLSSFALREATQALRTTKAAMSVQTRPTGSPTPTSTRASSVAPGTTNVTAAKQELAATSTVKKRNKAVLTYELSALGGSG